MDHRFWPVRLEADAGMTMTGDLSVRCVYEPRTGLANA